MRSYKNILIVRTDRMGDVILTTPAIAALRRTFPQAKISILVKPATEALVRGNPHLDEIILDDREKTHKGLSGSLNLVYEIRRKNFDLAILFHTKKRTNSICFLAGIPERVGYSNDKFGFLLTQKIADTRHAGRKHEAEYCLDVLKHLGIEANDLTLYLPLQPGTEEWAEQFFKTHHLSGIQKIIAIHPGASDPAKIWPMDNFIQLIERLRSVYSCKVILIGAENAADISQKIISAVKEGVLNLTGQTGVGQLASLLSRCHLLISNDSGPVHVADALGVPVVSIFLREQPGINPQRWRPLGKKSRVVSPASQSELIKPEQVLEAVDAIFKLC